MRRVPTKLIPVWSGQESRDDRTEKNVGGVSPPNGTVHTKWDELPALPQADLVHTGDHPKTPLQQIERRAAIARRRPRYGFRRYTIRRHEQ